MTAIRIKLSKEETKAYKAMLSDIRLKRATVPDVREDVRQQFRRMIENKKHPIHKYLTPKK